MHLMRKLHLLLFVLHFSIIVPLQMRKNFQKLSIEHMRKLLLPIDDLHPSFAIVQRISLDLSKSRSTL